MPKPKQPTSPPTAAPTTKLEVARALAEMCATQGWAQVFVPAMQRRRNQLLNAILKSEDPSRNFSAEIGAISVLDNILSTQGKNEQLLTMLQNFGVDRQPGRMV